LCCFEDAEKQLHVVVDESLKFAGKGNARTFQAMMNLGEVSCQQKRYEEAISQRRQSVEEFERLDRLDGHSPNETLVSRMSLTTTLANSGQDDEALKIKREVAQILGRRYADEHPRMPNMLHDLAVTINITNELGEARA
jgi:hypothetical protein